jgi:predicted TIM-barrel fold metal-dependent hydrolase
MTTLEGLTVGANASQSVTFLPDPEPRPRKFTIVSVDDHLVEPPDTFEGRMPARFAEQGPRIVERDDGSQVWLLEDRIIPNAGANANVGRPPSEYSHDPTRFDHMRRGSWDVNARVKDMDLAGLWASLCFPSMVAGFAGARFSETKDAELGLAAMRAWNDWHLESWVGAYPERFIPQQVTWLRDAQVAADEVRRNAERGFTSLSFPEMPEKLGLPSIYTGYWDPVMQACEETGTVLSLHVGSASSVVSGSSDAPADVVASLFFVGSIITTSDWLYSKIPLRFPDLRIAISEGGIGWVPALIDRLEHCSRYREYTGGWVGESLSPVEVLRRNFWFCALDDTAGFEMLDRIGKDRVVVECDYPHTDSTWPDTQLYLDRQLGYLEPVTIEKLTWQNASELYRFPVAERAVSGQWKESARDPGSSTP